jgi:hypothetical protein
MIFELWRQDDNGQRFLVDRHRNLDEAKRRLAELTRVQHKQIYWIAETMDSTDRTKQP